MIICLVVTFADDARHEAQFQRFISVADETVAHIFAAHPRIRLNSIGAAFGFGSMLAIWSCLAFHLAEAPFHAGSDMVGMLGACGTGAVAASGMGKYIPRFGIRCFSLIGATTQIAAWAIAFFFGDSYLGLIFAIIPRRHRPAMPATEQPKRLHTGDT